MSINWGAFAGAAANSALSTYERLGEEELRAMQRKEMRDRLAREAQERAIAAETFGKVGQDTEYGQAIATEGKVGAGQGKALSDQGRTGDAEFDRALAESAVGALRENAARQGVTGAEAPMKALSPQKYTEDQAYADYGRRMAGVDPRLARAARVEGLQVKDLARKDNQAELVEKAGQDMRNFLQESKDFAEKNGLPAAVAKYGFGIPGVNISVATGKDGQPVVNVLGKGNKVTQTIPLTMENYVNYISQLAEKKFVDTLSSANPDYFFKGRQLRNEERKTDIEEGFKGPGGVYERVQMADAAAKSRMYQGRGTPIGVSKDGSMILMNDGSTRPMPAGFTKEDIFPKNSGIKDAWSTVETELIKSGATPDEINAQQTAFYARRGYAPPALQATIESGINPVTKKPFTDAEIAAYNKKYPNTPYNPPAQSGAPAAPAAAPAAPKPAAQTRSALPVEAERAGALVDSARANLTDAQKQLDSYGLRKRKADPEGFEQARKAVDLARAEVRKAEQEYQTALPANVRSPFAR